MKAPKPAPAEQLPDPEDVLRVMLRTPPQPHVTRPAPPPKAKKVAKRKTAI